MLLSADRGAATAYILPGQLLYVQFLISFVYFLYDRRKGLHQL